MTKGVSRDFPLPLDEELIVRYSKIVIIVKIGKTGIRTISTIHTELVVGMCVKRAEGEEAKIQTLNSHVPRDTNIIQVQNL